MEQELKFGVEFAVVQLRYPQSTGEDGEFGGQGNGKFLVGGVAAQCLEKLRHKGVDLVVGAGGVGRELEHTHIGGLHVEGDRADLVVDVQYNVAGLALGVRHVVADQSGEVPSHDLH